MVYQAWDLTLERPVALKFLPPELTSYPDARHRLVREARAAAALDHPNICPVYEIGESGGQMFIAMALLEGQMLRDRIDQGPLPIADALRIAREVAEGLRVAHARGIIHRDIKPGNIMLTAAGPVSSAVVRNLRVTLLAGERARLEKRHTKNPDAYNLYLKGTQLTWKVTVECFDQALAWFAPFLRKLGVATA